MDWFRDLLGIPSIDLSTSPRESLVEVIVELIVAPLDPREAIEKSYGYLPFFLFFALVLFVAEAVVRLIRGATGKGENNELRELLYSSIWIFGLIPQAPGMIAAVRIFANTTGRYALTLFLGSDDPKVVTAKLSELTGIGPIDLMLSFIQIASLLILAIGLGIMIVAFAASVIILVAGMALRWLGDFGANALRWAISITLFSAVINLILMVLLGGTNAVARAIFPDAALWRGFMNTGAFVLAGFLVWKSINKFGASLKAVASKAAHGYQRARRTGGDENTTVDPDGSYRQERSAKNSRSRQEQAMSGHTSSNGSESNDSSTRRELSEPTKNDSGEASLGTNQSQEQPQPRSRRWTSTAARSVRHETDAPTSPQGSGKRAVTIEGDAGEKPEDRGPVQESSRRTSSANPEEHNTALRRRAAQDDT